MRTHVMRHLLPYALIALARKMLDKR